LVNFKCFCYRVQQASATVYRTLVTSLHTASATTCLHSECTSQPKSEQPSFLMPMIQPSDVNATETRLLPQGYGTATASLVRDDMEDTTRTHLELKAREHAVSLAIMHARQTF